MESEDFAAARLLLERRLAEDGDDHWLLTRIATTLYEERRYEEARRYGERALALAPRCPLVVWDLAGTEQMLGDHEWALRRYRRLIARSVEPIAHGVCDEGMAWANGLVADAHYRSALSLEALGRRRAAINAFDRHLAMRGRSCRSIYGIGEIRAKRKALLLSS